MMDPASSPTGAESAKSAATASKTARKRFVGSSKKVDAIANAVSNGPNGSIEDSAGTLVHMGPGALASPAVKVKANAIPDEILNNPLLNQAIKALPSNYNFEIHKTVHQIKQFKATRVALQFPEGLQMFACIISDILEQFTGVDTLIMGDVTYGACCIDDFTAKALECDFMVHYGHSCLVPVDITTVKTLYVFVDIQFDAGHFVEILKHNLQHGLHLALVGTIQFVGSLHVAKKELEDTFKVTVPQTKPLSPGEILGCTSPKLQGVDAIVYLGDGKFHLESILIHNPGVPAYRYDPYSSILTEEGYDHVDMRQVRKDAIERATDARKWGLILGTLGRQGSPEILQWVRETLDERGIPYIVVCMSEIFPARLAEFADVEAWVQVACPRLSIDWGRFFERPMLSPYEAAVALQATQWQEVYPMDFYAREDASGPWGVNWHRRRVRRPGTAAKRIKKAANGANSSDDTSALCCKPASPCSCSH